MLQAELLPLITETAGSMVSGIGIVCFLFAFIRLGLVEDMRARLVNGTSEAGRLEIFFNGEWSTVCNRDFDKHEALVACKMLGFNSTGVHVVSSAKYGAGTGTVLFDGLDCEGTETSLAQCAHGGPYYSSSCRHVYDVGVICNSVEDMRARLVNGTSEAGRLEIFFNGEWSTVCNRDFDKHEALVACKMLGFNSTGVHVVSSAKYGAGTGTILFYGLGCNGTETSLAQCEHYGPYYSRSCTHKDDVGVICNSAEAMRARLVNGTSEAGRLEIFFNGEWSTVCSGNFDERDALVACKMLGFNRTGAKIVSSAKYGAGTGTVLFDVLGCKGTETSLAQCEHYRPFYSRSCSHKDDVGVICNTAEAMRARLVNGTSEAGRLEIFFNGEWSTVCSGNFDERDALVACKMLGFNRTGAKIVSSAKYGAGTGTILFDVLGCKGTETSLAQCEHEGPYYSRFCSHENDVGVICNTGPSLHIVSENNTYPLLEGTSTNLSCEALRVSQSEIEYSWQETAGGRIFERNLLFGNVTRELHGKRVKCTASFMTDGRKQVLSSELELQVYYYPRITVTRKDNLGNLLQYHSSHILVTGGHDVTFRCEAESDPPPASITWSGNVNSSTGDLQILAADQAVHGGVYTCTVVTRTLPGDRRLPLTSSRQITVVVTETCGVAVHGGCVEHAPYWQEYRKEEDRVKQGYCRFCMCTKRSL